MGRGPIYRARLTYTDQAAQRDLPPCPLWGGALWVLCPPYPLTSKKYIYEGKFA